MACGACTASLPDSSPLPCLSPRRIAPFPSAHERDLAFVHSEAAVHSMISLSKDTVHQSAPASLIIFPCQIRRPECPYVQASNPRHEPWLCVTHIADYTATHFSTCLPFASFEAFSFKSITSMLSVELMMLAPSSSPRLTTRSLSFGTVNIT